MSSVSAQRRTVAASASSTATDLSCEPPLAPGADPVAALGAQPRLSRRWLGPTLILGAWLLWGLLWSGEFMLSAYMAGRSPPFSRALLVQMPLALMWALATPGILWLGRSFPFRRGRWPLSLVVHLAASSALVFVLTLFYVANLEFWAHLPHPPTYLERVTRVLSQWFLSDGLLYWLVLGLGYAADQYHRYRERELAASRLETQLAQARLEALKMQLQPHFLFNALHTVGTLVRTGESQLAVRVVARLGDLLRRILDEAATQLVRLGEELALTELYLEIERIRFHDRLRVEIQVPAELRDASVPHLILQPLVENAIRHGIAPSSEGGLVSVGAAREGDTLWLTVRDDGRGAANVGNSGSAGVGLANTRSRLVQLYGDRYHFSVEDAVGGGTVVRLGIPWQPAAAPAQP